MTGYLIAALAGVLFAAVVFCRLWRSETRAADQLAADLKAERAARRDAERQLAAAVDALLAPLTHITPEDFR
jgi:ABC-type transporter MlaC component